MKPQPTRHFVNIATVAAFLAGSLTWYKIKGIGELFGSELALPLAVLTTLAIRSREYRLPSLFWRFVALSVLMLGGYIVADIVGETDIKQSFRAWARITALISDFVCISVLITKDKRTLLAYSLGSAVSTFIYAAIAGVEITRWNWKLGYGDHAAVLLACIGSALHPLLSSIAFGALGAISVVLDSRAQGAVALVVSGLLLLGTSQNMRRNRTLQLYCTLALVLCISSSILYVLLSQTASENVSRRSNSDIMRFAALRIGTEAILDSPILGYGSWGNGTEKYAIQLYKETAADVAALGFNVESNPKAFQPHSQILQAWMEGGLFAGAFFLFYGYHMFLSLRYLIVLRTRDQLSPLLLWTLTVAAWHLIMSPFAGFMRLYISVAIAVTVLISCEIQAHRARPTILPTVI